jgi:hypothetical protein
MITKEEQSDLISLIDTRAARLIDHAKAASDLNESERKLNMFIWRLANPPKEKE